MIPGSGPGRMKVNSEARQLEMQGGGLDVR